MVETFQADEMEVKEMYQNAELITIDVVFAVG